jgi:uncharacterized protein YndB with AHSA1/START domain
MTVAPQGPDAGKKAPIPPPWIVLADAKLTVRAPLPRVFEALVNAEQLGRWWAHDVRVEAELGGRYEGTLAEGRIEGTITAIDGPGQLSFTWPIASDAGPVETTVAYHLSPKGPESSVRLLHRAPKPIPGDWNGLWQRAFESLSALLEGDAPGSA